MIPPREGLRSSVARVLIALASAAFTPAAHAHGGGEAIQTVADVALSVLLLTALLAYLQGARRLWRAAPGHRRTTFAYCAAFAGGWCAMTAALLPPLARVAADTFSAHMLQHEVLMVLAAPLLVLGRPLAIWMWAMNRAWRTKIGRLSRHVVVRGTWRWMSDPLAASVIHAAAIWLWHAPPLFGAAQHGIGWHALQHASFLFSALLFWSAVLKPSERALGPSMFWLFITMLHTGALGVLLTFAPVTWYPAPAGLQAWGLTPHEDQQLGGLIMWIPGGMIYMIAALGLAMRALSGTPRSRTPELRTRR